MRIIGSKMALARDLVARGSYPSKHALARQVGPHGSARYGYEIVQRALAAGLIQIDPHHPDRAVSGDGAVVLGPSTHGP